MCVSLQSKNNFYGAMDVMYADACASIHGGIGGVSGIVSAEFFSTLLDVNNYIAN